MVYHVLGLMSGSSLDGLDIAYCILNESGGRWSFTIPAAGTLPFSSAWKTTLLQAPELSGRELLRAHTAFGHWMGQQVNDFIRTHDLQHKIHLIGSHGHTVFHEPHNRMSFQLGDGAALAAETGLPVVSDLRNLDVALGGQGAPIVPVGEKLLWSEYRVFLNIGGISNLTVKEADMPLAFDVCPANRVLNALAQELGQPFDQDGAIARSGNLLPDLLEELNALPYYREPAPKSLANEFGTQQILPMLQRSGASVPDLLRTMSEHIAVQVSRACALYGLRETPIFITGGGALNGFLVERIGALLQPTGLTPFVPDEQTVQYKEALVMALIAALRWREEPNVLGTVTGASRSSCGGALWMGQD